MAWWQKKLLQYALSRTGLLDDQAIDFNNLDITLGRKNVVELKNVALNIKRITKLAQLPPSLRIETARVLSLRLTVPADIYQSSIIAEVDGVEISLKLDDEINQRAGETRARSTYTEHHSRKINRRGRSPSPDRHSGSEHLLTAEELARSFLQEEPIQEREQLEATVVGNEKSLDASIASESSGSEELGTGGSLGLPGFLAGFLQGIVDRLRVTVRNLEVKVETEIPGESLDNIPVTLRIHLDEALLDDVPGETDQQSGSSKRKIDLRGFSVDLCSEAFVFSALSELTSQGSPSTSKSNVGQSFRSSNDAAISSRSRGEEKTSLAATGEFHVGRGLRGSSIQPHRPPDSAMTSSTEPGFTSNPIGDYLVESSSNVDQLEIQPGDDNVTWGSRRNQFDATARMNWSPTNDEEFTESLLIDRSESPRVHNFSKSHSFREQGPDLSTHNLIKSPGSWPQLDSSPKRSRPEDDSGLKVISSRSQHNVPRPSESASEINAPRMMDNKKSALEYSADDDETVPESPPSPAEDQLAAMAESRVYSHEEAESMYMSAMSQSIRMNIPGGWGLEDSRQSRSLSLEQERMNQSEYFEETGTEVYQSLTSEQKNNIDQEAMSGNATPRQKSPTRLQEEVMSHEDKSTLVSKRILFVDVINVRIPNKVNVDKSEEGDQVGRPATRQQRDRSTSQGRMPGTFSAYSELAASRRRGISSTYSESQSVVWAPPEEPDKFDIYQALEVQVGNVELRIDVPSCRLIYKSASSVIANFRKKDISSDKSAQVVEGGKPTAVLPFSIRVQQLHFAWMETIHEHPIPVSEELTPLFAATCQETTVESHQERTEVSLGCLRLCLGESELLSFDRRSNMGNSMVAESSPDVKVTIASSTVTVDGRPVTYVDFETMPLRVLVDFAVFEDTLVAFGGLSGMIELGNSVLSENSRRASPGVRKPSKGVRFEDQPSYVDLGPVYKISGRINEVELILRGGKSAVTARTDLVKMIYREEGSSIITKAISIYAGFDPNTDGLANGRINAPVTLDLSDLGLKYLPSPQDDDLERLISLLTPSKDKYDTDEDIMLDTLLRQRRKGGLLRTEIGGVKLKVSNFDCFESLKTLADELSKLSVVADYLPEDERPGLLTAVRIKRIETQIPCNERIGPIRMLLQESELVHVGLPALFALSAGTLVLNDVTGRDLVHALVPPRNVENLPMVMVRMIGDDFEPTLKVKLFNTCVEYSVATLLDLMDVKDETNTEEIITELVQSTASIVHLPQLKNIGIDSAKVETTSDADKKTTLVLLVHDCAIGLKPEKLPAKGIFVMTDARLSVPFPAEQVFEAELSLRKAAIFITDSAITTDEPVDRGALNNSSINAWLGLFLSKQGYVSVGSMMSARISVRATDASDETKSVEVDVKNELLLLETCADSTQTLIGILSGLAPPAPPNKQPTYRTEAMTIEDMMASFSGEAVAKPESSPELLFSADEGPTDDMIMSLTLDQADELLAESQLTSSLYGPVSGVFGGNDHPDDSDFDDGHPSETAESLLEEDPFEMTASPTESHLADAVLVRDLNRQCKPVASNDPVDLGIWEIEDLGFDALGRDHQPLGSQNRFNTPMSVRPKTTGAYPRQTLPFVLRLRDTHVIWNIYDGYDWRNTRETITRAVEEVEIKAEERKARRRQSLNELEDDESVIGDFLFNSVYIGVPASHDAQELRRQINRNIDDLVSETESIPVSGISRDASGHPMAGRSQRPKKLRRLKLDRSRKHKVGFELKGLSADVLVFPPGKDELLSSVDVQVKDLEVFDNVSTSTWKKFLTHFNDGPDGREMSKPMVHLELLNVKTLDQYAASEIALHVSILPLRLHVDQDTLDFITRFFEFKDENMANMETQGDPPFLQRVEVDTVDLQLDYKPKYVDYGGIRSGHTTEFMNFIGLDAANIRLKHAIIYGIRGFEPLHKTLNDVWMPDVKRNQLPTILAGLAPVRSLVNIGSGVRDVVAIPIREYRRDGRVMRSVQKGVTKFGKTTTSELARLAAKLSLGTQTMLQGAEGFLSQSERPSAAMQRRGSEQGWHDLNNGQEEDETRAISAYANQPLNILAGIRSGGRQLEHDLLTARDALIAVSAEVMESRTPGAAAAAVVRHAPVVILRPVIGASGALGKALLGVGNQIDRTNISRADDKYKRR